MSRLNSQASGPLSARANRAIFGLVGGQLAVAIGAAAAFGALGGAHQAYSALVGGLIAVIPNAYFGLRLVRRRYASAADNLRSIYAGAFIKIAFSCALFVIAIRVLNTNFVVVIAGFAAASAANWIGLLKVNLAESAQEAAPKARP